MLCCEPHGPDARFVELSLTTKAVPFQSGPRIFQQLPGGLSLYDKLIFPVIAALCRAVFARLFALPDEVHQPYDMELA